MSQSFPETDARERSSLAWRFVGRRQRSEIAGPRRRRRASRMWFVWLLFQLTAAGLSHGEDWPGWRGPRGDGSSQDANPPLHWDGTTGEHIRWKATVPGTGCSSPVVLGDQIYLTTCDEPIGERQLLGFDRATGRLQMRVPIFSGPLETIHAFNSRASSTPVTDGQAIFVAFMKTDGTLIPAPNVGTPRDITTGRLYVAAFTLDGQLLWESEPGPFVSAHGFAVSPVLYDDLVIVNGDHDGDSYIVALDKRTGTQRWRRTREHGIRSYVTPLIREVDGRPQMFLAGSRRVVSFNPRDGETHWFLDGPTDQVVASLCHDGQQLYLTCGYPDYFVTAVRTQGQGDVTATGIAWQSTQAKSYVPSPVLIGNHLIVADDRGTANCFAAATGHRHWQHRVSGGFHASLIHADGMAYLIAQDGETTIVRAGDAYQEVARNPLGEPVTASPALSNGQLFIRSEHTLWCIE